MKKKSEIHTWVTSVNAPNVKVLNILLFFILMGLHLVITQDCQTSVLFLLYCIFLIQSRLSLKHLINVTHGFVVFAVFDSVSGILK